MKKLFTLLTVAFCISNVLIAQVPPNAFNYSAVARNAAGVPIANTTIGIQIGILKTSALGALQYQENHFVNTDAFGLFNLTVGAGAVQSGSMAAINWSNDNYYLKVGMDANGSTNFLTMGTTQLLSVPYALHAKTAESIAGGAAAETDPIFGTSVAKGITTADTANWNNKQQKLIAGAGISITNNTITASNAGGAGNFTHYIGEQFGGGVIFHLFKDNTGAEHGLIVDLTDLSTAQVWSNVDNILIGSAAQCSWDGLSNSNAIINQAGHTNSAAALCLNSTNGGQSDWYLPSVQELNMLYNNNYTVSKSISQIAGATQLAAYLYWSSSEVDFVNVSAFDLGSGDATTNGGPTKDTPYYVRAVRAF